MRRGERQPPISEASKADRNLSLRKDIQYARDYIEDPSQESWDGLGHLISGTEYDIKNGIVPESVLETLVSYIEAHLEDWDDDLRVLPGDLVIEVYKKGTEILSKSAIARLSRTLIIPDENDAFDPHGKGILASPALQDITKLKLGKKAVRNIDIQEYPPSMKNLESVDFSGSGLNSKNLNTFLESGLFKGVRELNVDENALSAEDIVTLFTSGQLDEVEKLTIGGIFRDPSGKHLSEGFKLKGLKELSIFDKFRFSQNERELPVLSLFGDGSVLKGVEKLDIRGGYADPRLMDRVMRDNDFTPKVLALDGRNLSESFFEILASKEGTTILEELDSNSLSMENQTGGFKDFIHSMYAENIKRLSFNSGGFSDAHLRELVNSKSMAKLESLDLNDTQISSAGLVDLFKNASFSLKEINVGTLPFDREVMQAFIDSSQEHVEKLHLGYCGIVGSGLILMLTQSEKLKTVTELDLSNNEINEEGIRALAESSSLSNLEKLDISGHMYQGVPAILNSESLKSIKELRISAVSLDLLAILEESKIIDQLEVFHVDTVYEDGFETTGRFLDELMKEKAISYTVDQYEYYQDNVFEEDIEEDDFYDDRPEEFDYDDDNGFY